MKNTKQTIEVKGTEGSILDKSLVLVDTTINWLYPEIYNSQNRSKLEISLFHTRAADSIRIQYDSERDGWIIEQASVFKWKADDKICDPKWKEVAFIQAWALEEENEL